MFSNIAAASEPPPRQSAIIIVGRERPLLYQFLSSKKDKTVFSAALDEIAPLFTDITSDRLLEASVRPSVVGREKEAREAIDTLLRIRDRIPMFVGGPETGKTMMGEAILRELDVIAKDSGSPFQRFAATSVIVRSRVTTLNDTQPQDFFAQRKFMLNYLDGVNDAQLQLGFPIIFIIDNIHEATAGQLAGIRDAAETYRELHLVLTGEAAGIQAALSKQPALAKKVTQIPINELSPAQVVQAINARWSMEIYQKYNVALTEKIIQSLVERAIDIYPSESLLGASARAVQDFSIWAQQNNKRFLNEDLVYEFIQSKQKFPVNLRDGQGLEKYRETTVAALNSKVLDQKRMVNDVVSEWISVLRDRKRGVRTVLIPGFTGVGKSELGRQFAVSVLDNNDAFLEVDGTKYQDELNFGIFFGVTAPYTGSERGPGELHTFLRDVSKGGRGGVILINEPERASAKFWERMMELIDVGYLQGNDGQNSRANKILILLATNRGSTVLLPPWLKDATPEAVDRYIRSVSEDQIRQGYQQKGSGDDRALLPAAIFGRIDKMTIAKPNSLVNSTALIRMKLNEKATEYFEKYGVKVEVEDALVAEFAARYYSYDLGGRKTFRPAVEFAEDILTQALAQFTLETPLTKADTVRLQYAAGDTNASVKLDRDAHSLVRSFPLPAKKINDPLDDPQFIARMKTIEAKLKTRVIGQEYAVQALVRVAKAHLSRPGLPKRPSSLFLVGTTGLGKTLLAKSLAEAVYDDFQRVEVISMGDVMNESHLNNIMGSPKGYSGSGEIAAFEEALRKLPEGGVIAFDEISNMGGDNPQIKAALFKSFYNMLEEGVWKSPATGKTYELGKYVFIFTGNDGEKFFQDHEADDMRISTWERYRAKDKVLEFLRKAGVPEAFLGRMLESILMKPLTREEMRSVTKIMIEETLKPFRDQRGLDFDYDDRFIADFTQAFFTQSQGARSVRSMLESKLEALINDVIFERGLSAVRGQKLKLEFEAPEYRRTYLRKRDPLFKLLLKVQFYDTDLKENRSLVDDLTLSAPTRKVQTFDDASSTAYHEAGHAVLNNPDETGYKLAFLTIRPSNGYLGYARYEEVENRYSKPFTRDSLVHYVAKVLGGTLAQSLAGYAIDTGRRGDAEHIRQRVNESLLKGGLITELLAVRMKGKDNEEFDLNDDQKAILDREIKKIYDEAEIYALKILRENWDSIRKVTAKLMSAGSIKGSEFETLMGQPKAAHADHWVAAPEDPLKMIREKRKMAGSHAACDYVI